MVDVIIYIIAFLMTVPMFLTTVIYFLSIKFHQPVWKAVHAAVNWSTIFYIMAVILILDMTFDLHVIGIVLVFFLLLLGLFIYLQWKFNTEVKVTKAFKLVWRICFLLFLILYICLVIIGIIIEFM
ncbi:DUF3397 domain-containing protein [Oceanobacillus chungangensis]|uniref:DUF3397 domain-containing protein n=1 Tax=Oceanobacillus chungangensis TaxID=1229152 RepID=A0A3D8PSG8_9BACI|nr:DUF3397 domain-containing protein [Oceanobacillus chungangensis]RDW17935.1 DUF3397 domain-containing protein [Oceanobacillus chungangensis]